MAEVTALQRIERHEEPAGIAPNLFGSPDPKAAVEVIAEYAGVLKDVLDKQKLTSNIGGKRHVNVEGWTLLGSMLGVFPVLTWTRPLTDGEKVIGWEARVEAITRAGEVVGAAEAMCTRKERTWATRDDYALRSMAQTRATSKALRQPLGFIVILAGYEATPEEELPGSKGSGSGSADEGSRQGKARAESSSSESEHTSGVGAARGTPLADTSAPGKTSDGPPLPGTLMPVTVDEPVIGPSDPSLMLISSSDIHEAFGTVAAAAKAANAMFPGRSVHDLTQGQRRRLMGYDS